MRARGWLRSAVLLAIVVAGCASTEPHRPAGPPSAAPTSSSARGSSAGRPRGIEDGDGPAERLAILRELAATAEGGERLDLQRALYLELLRRDGAEARAEATALLEAIVVDAAFAGWDHADEALFDLGTSLQAARQPARALDAWRRLVAEHPRSRLAPDAHVALADAAFDAAELDAALAGYRAALRFPDARVADYARYKLGWVHLNLADHTEAMVDFLGVVEHASDPLRREALKDVVRVYAETGEPARALAFFESLDAGRAGELTLRLARTYAELGRHAEAELAFRAAMPRLDVERRCEAALGLARARVAIGRKAAVLAAFEELIDRHPIGACGQEAEELIVEVARAWELEVRRTLAPPDDVIRCWQLAQAVAQSDDAYRAAAAAEAALRAP